LHVSERNRAYRRQVLMPVVLELQAGGCSNSEIASELNRRSVPGIRTTAPWTGTRNGRTVLKTETHLSRQARAAGLHAHQLRPGQKIPAQARWQHAPRLTDEQVATLDLRQWGVRLDGLIVVDLDTKRDPDAATADFQQLLEEVPGLLGAGLIVESGSRNGARHYYFRLPDGFEGKTGKYGGHIDLLTGNGHQVVGPGSIHPETGYEYRIVSGSFDEIDEAPAALLALIAKPEPQQLPTRTAESLASDGELGEMLSYVANDDVEYDPWLCVGMALHAASDGQAFDLWCRWSEQSAKHVLAGMADKWASFATERDDAIGVSTLRWMAVKGGCRARRADEPAPRVLAQPD